MRFKGECFRAHDPAWAWSPLSGAGAALKGRRFNWPGLEALYLSLSFNTVFREVSGGFAHRLTPYVLCSYDVDCEDIADLRTDADRAALGVDLNDLACAWGDALIAGREPESWAVVRRSHGGWAPPAFSSPVSPTARRRRTETSSCGAGDPIFRTRSSCMIRLGG